MFKKEYFIKYEKFTQPWKTSIGKLAEPTLKQDPYLRVSDSTGFLFHVETKTCIQDGYSAEDAWAEVTHNEHNFNGLRLLNIQKV